VGRTRSRYGEEKRFIKGGSVGKPEGRRPLGRPRLRWKIRIKMDFQTIGWVEGA
jgi:hypothetical protein